MIMINKNLAFYPSIFILVLILGLSSCTYNNEEELYPVMEIEDDVSYANDVLPIIETNCYSCHQDAAICGDVNLEGYDNLVLKVEDGSLLGTMRHEDGWVAMPQGADKLSNSLIERVSTWIDEGYPNN